MQNGASVQMTDNGSHNSPKALSITPLYNILNQIHSTQKMQKVKSIAGKNVRQWLNAGSRKCRNIIFLILFIATVGGSIYFEFFDK